MSFISVLLALLIEQARPLGPGNRVHGLTRVWVRWSSRNFDGGQPGHAWLAWACATVLPAALSLVVHWLLDAWLGWPAALLWSVAILYVTLGFRQFSSHFTQIRDALADGNEVLARELLARWQQIDARDLPRSEIVRHVIEHSVIAAHRHVFGVLAWFSVLAAFGLGPAGAVLYRLSEFVARYWWHNSKTGQQTVSEASQQVARQAWRWIDWIPARVTAVSFAVVGSFEEAIDGWRNYERSFGDDNDALILAATAGAVNIRLNPLDDAHPPLDPASPAKPGIGQTPELAHLAVVVGLVWRTVVMWIVLLALLTLARLLG
ncbi:MAG: CobD/CbiB family protein [Betaproteobacteria bacterium]